MSNAVWVQCCGQGADLDRSQSHTALDRSGLVNGRPFRFVFWCLLALTLSGCSATQFIYNRVDILVRWYLDDYVSLDREQQARFDDRFDLLIEWHRREELPVYGVLLDDALTILDDDVPLQATTTWRIKLKLRRFVSRISF